MTDVKELIERLRKQGIGPYADDRDEVIDILHEAASALESLSQELAERTRQIEELKKELEGRDST